MMASVARLFMSSSALFDMNAQRVSEEFSMTNGAKNAAWPKGHLVANERGRKIPRGDVVVGYEYRCRWHTSYRHSLLLCGTTCTPLQCASTRFYTHAEMAESTFTVGEAVEAVGYGPYQRRMRLVLGGFWAADASEMLILSFVGPVVMCEWGLTRSEEAAITSVVSWECSSAPPSGAGTATASAVAVALWPLPVCAPLLALPPRARLLTGCSWSAGPVGVGTSGGHVCATLMSEMLLRASGEAILGSSSSGRLVPSP